jgi:hypothetical protein
MRLMRSSNLCAVRDFHLPNTSATYPVSTRLTVRSGLHSSRPGTDYHDGMPYRWFRSPSTIRDNHIFENNIYVSYRPWVRFKIKAIQENEGE